MNVAFLSLGGNLGRRLDNIDSAVDAIKATGASVIRSSQTYETAAWGSTSEKKFLNRIIKIRTLLSAKKLLKELLQIELQLGRIRNEDRNSDRTIDIDILFFNSEVINEEHLHIPHPRLPLRKFVLLPLNEIAHDFEHPVLKQSISSLLKKCKDNLEVTPYRKPLYICIEGNIGSGKTTIAKALAKKLKVNFLPELFEENHFLPLFYQDPKTYAFHAEYSFFISRMKQLQDYFETAPESVIADYSIYKSLWFAGINLPQAEYRFFRQKVSPLMDLLPRPDLIIYLDTSLKNLKQNINTRNRSYEKNITTDYLTLVADEYKKALKTWPENKQLILQIDNYKPTTVKEITDRISLRLKKNV